MYCVFNSYLQPEGALCTFSPQMTHDEEQAYHVTFQELTEASRDRYNHGYNMQINISEDNKYTIVTMYTCIASEFASE